MILALNSNTSPCHFAPAHVSKVLTGADEVVLAVQLHTSKLSFNRTSVKVYPLPIDKLYFCFLPTYHPQEI